MDILLKTIADLLPMLALIGAVALFIAGLYVTVETPVRRATLVTPRRKLSWDLTGDTRFLSLD